MLACEFLQTDIYATIIVHTATMPLRNWSVLTVSSMKEKEGRPLELGLRRLVLCQSVYVVVKGFMCVVNCLNFGFEIYKQHEN